MSCVVRVRWILVTIAILLCLFSIWAWLYKPKASPENIEKYIRVFNPRPSLQAMTQQPAIGIPTVKDTLGQMAHGLRPTSYQPLKDEPSN